MLNFFFKSLRATTSKVATLIVMVCITRVRKAERERERERGSGSAPVNRGNDIFWGSDLVYDITNRVARPDFPELIKKSSKGEKS